MKNLFVLFLIPLAIISGCGHSNEGEKKDNLSKGEYDLSKQGLSLIIKAPSEPLVEAAGGGAYTVQSSDVFKIKVHEGAGDVGQKKKDLEADEVFKVEKFISDEPNALFYEIKGAGISEYHFYVVLKNEKTSFEIEDDRSKMYSEEEIKNMFEAAKNARIKE